MRILIASDIHGSILHCNRLLAAFERAEADRLLLLGDLLYHGPRNELPVMYDPQSVAGSLNAFAEYITCVRGNCDAEVDQTLLDFPILSESLLMEVNGRILYATHGHRENPDNPPKLPKGAILLNGHTHVPAYRDCGDFIYMNPGSVSLPKEDSAHSCLLFTPEGFFWQTLAGGIYMEYPI